MTMPPLPELRTAAQAAHIALTCISTHPTLDMSDYLRGRVDAAAAGLEAALAAVPAQPVATSARGLLAAWQAAANVLFVSRSSGQYTTDTVSRNDLIQLIEAAFAAAPQAVPTDKDSLMVAQAVPVPADMALTDDPWRKLYRRAINEANGLTNYVEDRPELRGAERRLAAIEAEARTLAATFEPTPEKKP